MATISVKYSFRHALKPEDTNILQMLIFKTSFAALRLKIKIHVWSILYYVCFSEFLILNQFSLVLLAYFKAQIRIQPNSKTVQHRSQKKKLCEVNWTNLECY